MSLAYLEGICVGIMIGFFPIGGLLWRIFMERIGSFRSPLETRLLNHLVTVTALLEDHARFSDNDTERKACEEALELIEEMEKP